MLIDFKYDRDTVHKQTHPNGKDTCCFFCGQHLAEGKPTIAWVGKSKAGSDDRAIVLLHATCANELILRLAVDVHAYEMVMGKKVTDPATVVLAGLDSDKPFFTSEPPKGTAGE
jgi:hypothetical protein